MAYGIFRGMRLLPTLFAFKAADQSKTSDATPAMDGTLVLNVAANSTYRLRACLRFNLATDNPGLDFSLGGTAGIANVAGGMRKQKDSTTFTAHIDASSANPNGAGSGGDYWYDIDYLVETTTAGTLGILWSQDTSHADAATLKRGSFIEAALVAG